MIAEKSIILVGMMGSGKTSFGRKLAARLKLPFVDADHEIEKETGSSIPAIFEKEGEARFRKREKNVIARLLAGKAVVLATGGGAVLDADNRALLKKNICIWLQADIPSLLARVAHDKNRPLLQNGDPASTLAKLLEARRGFYAEAHIHLKTDDAPFSETLEKLLQLIDARQG